MNDVIEVFDDLLRPIYQPLLPYLMPALIVTVVTVGAVRFGLPLLIKTAQRWANYEHQRHVLQPKTWFKLQPRHHYKLKSSIISNRAVREVFAPTERYVRDLREKEKNYKLAWLSPYPRAVKATISEAHLPTSKKVMAHKQTRDVAKRVEVCSLPKGIIVGNGLGDGPEEETPEEKQKRLEKARKANERNHFRVRLDATGDDPAVIEKVKANIMTQLDLQGGLEPFNDGNRVKLTFLAHKEEMIDMLTETKLNASFFDENPAKSVYAIPLAMTQDMRPWTWEVHHTLIYGQTGSGKGSPIQGAIHQLAPYVKKGVAKLYGIDPKISELRVYNEWRSSLFERISVGMQEEDMADHAETIAELKELIGHRAKHGAKTNIREGQEEDGRDFEASRENPMILFIIDEFPTLFKGFEQLGRAGKKPLSDLAQIILTGRSYGVYIMAATQRGDKAILDAIIDSMTHKIVLRQSNAYFNGQMLGDNYLENGCNPAAIGKATKANGFKTAGIGYVQEGDGQSKLRFAYISRVEISALVREFLELDGISIDEAEMTDFVDGSGEWALPTLADDEDDDLDIPYDAEREDRTIEDYLIADDGDFKMEELPTLSDD